MQYVYGHHLAKYQMYKKRRKKEVKGREGGQNEEKKKIIAI